MGSRVVVRIRRWFFCVTLCVALRKGDVDVAGGRDVGRTLLCFLFFLG